MKLSINTHHHRTKLQASLRQVAANILVLFGVVLVAGYAFRIRPVDETLIFWSVIPPVLWPRWFQHDEWDWFLWTKLLSLIPLAVMWVSTIRLGIDETWTRLGSFAILSLHIAEAVAKDIYSSKRARKAWSRLNAFSGMLLIVAQIPTIRTIRISDAQDFIWDLGKAWISAYTIWNWTFICNNYPYAVGRHAAVLTVPLLMAWHDGWDTWLQARGYTLAFYAMVRSTFYDQIVRETNVTYPARLERVRQILAFCCVASLLTFGVVTPQQQESVIPVYGNSSEPIF